MPQTPTSEAPQETARQQTETTEAPPLQVRNLKTYFHLDEGILKAVDDVSFDVHRGEAVGIVGESGCGKSVTSLSILQLLPKTASIEGEVLFYKDGQDPIDLLQLNANSRAMRNIRGGEISIIFQEPMTCLSPVHTIGAQIMEAIDLHKDVSKRECRQQAIEMLNKVGIPRPDVRVDEYPHQLSGGLRQRAMIAMALSCDPRLLIADEPTTALDVTIQAQILKLLTDLQDQFDTSILYITHSLPVISEICNQVKVMYLGRVVEYGTTEDIFDRPYHPYTRGLLKAIPKLGREAKKRLETIEGTVPLPLGLPERCPFFDRCPRAMEGKCDMAVPELIELEPGHGVRCYLYE